MSDPLENSGSGSQDDETVVPRRFSMQVDETHSGKEPVIETFGEVKKSAPSELSVFKGEDEQTVISSKPASNPKQRIQNVALEELAKILEGKQLDHFAVEEIIGGGGMGAVFRGRDLRLERFVAVKVVPAAKRDVDTLRRFRLEAQAAARLDHPNIARVFYIGEAEDWNYIVFEFIDGINIRDLVTEQGPLSVDDAVYFTRQVAEALQHAHDRDVVHRDIKPSNILVAPTGQVKVVDMGLARNTGMDQSTNDATASGVTLGTFDYISPEQARNPRDADVRSDLYSLGCSLFFMLTGNPPFSEGTVLQKLLKHGSVPPPDPRGWRDDLSDQLYAILMKLMAKQPNDRYQNPGELINDLLLLAEVEDLPRSQLTGNYFVAPAFSQKSLLEANLPWMVAFAFLLGSTLWMYAVQTISAMDELSLDESVAITATEDLAASEPRRMAEPAVGGAASNSTSTNNVGSSDASASVVDAPSDLTSTYLVVSEFRPAAVAEQNWFPTLQQALEKAREQSIKSIEIQGYVLLDELLTIENLDLELRGNQTTRSRVEVSPQLVRDLPDWGGVISLESSRLSVKDLAINMDVVERNEATHGLFRVSGNSELLLESSVITLKGNMALQTAVTTQPRELSVMDSSVANPFVMLVDEVVDASDLFGLVSEDLPELPIGDLPIAELPIGDYRDTTIAIQGSDIRGQGSLIGLRANLGEGNRFSATLSNALVAVTGYSLVAMPSASDLANPIERNLRLFCEHSTVASQSGFARLEYVLDNAASTTSTAGLPQMNLNRDSKNSVFIGDPAAAHIQLWGVPVELALANANRFLFKGSDNAYGDGLKTLCSCHDPISDTSLPLYLGESSVASWFEERGIDRGELRWRNVRSREIVPWEATRPQFLWEEGPYSPGIRAD